MKKLDEIIAMAKAGLGSIDELLKIPSNIQKSLMEEYKKNIKDSQKK